MTCERLFTWWFNSKLSPQTCLFNGKSILELELDSYQEHVLDRFLDLSSLHHDDLLSFKWVGKFLDCFLIC